MRKSSLNDRLHAEMRRLARVEALLSALIAIADRDTRDPIDVGEVASVALDSVKETSDNLDRILLGSAKGTASVRRHSKSQTS